ncbi:hypothetical protein ABVT39_027782 [Epinephelus coioides]
MRGGSVRLTRAIRLAACGKEPEEKLSERRQQTAGESDLFISAQKNQRSEGENTESKNPTGKEKRKRERQACDEQGNKQILLSLLKKMNVQMSEERERRLRTDKTVRDKNNNSRTAAETTPVKMTNISSVLQKRKREWRENGKRKREGSDKKPETTPNRNCKTTKLLSHL